MSEPGAFGSIVSGDGSIILPGPSIDPDHNLIVRDYEDRTFRWGEVVGLESDPSLGYQTTEAAYYKLELTPDLGWSNIDAMFVPYVAGSTTQGNAKLIILDRLALVDDLTVVGDGTVSYAVPLDTMKKLLAPGYPKYLWRVSAISTSGHVGEPSSVQNFTGRVVVPSTTWTIDPVPKTARSLTITLTGTKEPGIASIEINGSTTLTSFPSVNRWKAEVPLGAGRNTFSIRAIDAQDNTSEYRTVEVELTSKDLSVHSLWNKFDDFGYLMDLGRLPGENNADYKDRIQDVMVHRASPKYMGLMNGLLRELDLGYYDRAILAAPGVNQHTDRNVKVMIWANSTSLFVHSTRMIRQHVYHKVNQHDLTVLVDDARIFGRLTVEQPIGVLVPENDYEFSEGVIKFRLKKYANDPVFLTYEYVEKVDFGTHTLDSFISAVNALTFNGVPLVTMTLGDQVGSDLSASGIMRFPPVVLGEGTYRDAAGEELDGQYPIRWAEIKLYAFMDKAFKSQYLNSNGSYFGTKYDAWAARMKAFMRTTWGLLVADDNVWTGKKIKVSGIGSLDTVYDARSGYWMAPDGTIYPTYMAEYLDYIDPVTGVMLVYVGVPEEWVLSGVGDGDDLYVTIDGEEEADFDQEPQDTLGVTSNSTDEIEDVDLGFGTNVVDSSSEVS